MMPSQILLFSQPRSASNMLARIFEDQSDLTIRNHPFSSSRSIQMDWMRSDSVEKGMPSETFEKFKAEIDNANDDWKTQLIQTEAKDQSLMVNTHLCYPLAPETILRHLKSLKEDPQPKVSAANCTMIPDALLLHQDTVPVFTIRDPRLAVPSANRTMQLMGIEHGGGMVNYFSVTCPIWGRMLYDCYVSHGTIPLVIDADDYVTDADFVRSLCSRIGLRPEELKLEWAEATDEEKKDIHPMYYASQSTLINSSGPDPGLAGKNLDLEKLAESWDGEFEEDATMMRELVALAMPHYEYLLERKWKP